MSWPLSQEEPKTEEVPWWSRKKVWLIAGVAMALILAIVLVVVVLCTIFLATDGKDEQLVEHIKSMMMSSFEPCDKFYEYACGRWWLSSNMSEPLKRVSRISLMKENYEKKMLGLLEKQPIQDTDPVHTRKPREFYAECMNIDKVEKKQASEFLSFVKSKMSVPLLDSSWQETDFNLQSTIEKLAAYGVSTLFYMTFEDYGFGSMIYVRNPITNIETEGYKEWVLSTLQTLGVNTKNNADIQAMFKLEEEIIELKRNYSKEQPKDLTNWMQMDGAHWLNWRDFFIEVQKEILKKNVYIEMKLKVENIPLMASFSRLYFTNNYRTLVNYFFMSLLRYTSALDSRFKLFLQPDDVIVSNRKIFSERSQKCLYETTEIFPELVTIMFAEEFLSKESFSFIKDMTRTLTKAYADVIKESKWLSGDGKSSSTKMVEELNVTVGVPEYFADLKIDTLYANVPSDDYFESIHVSVLHRFQNRIWQYSNTDVEKWLWNKYWNEHPYTLVEGKERRDTFMDEKFIILPNEFLLSPVFEAKWRSSMKYGALGSIIGHQITHGFVYKFLDSWFNAIGADMPAVEAKKSCLTKQYSDFTLTDVKGIDPIEDASEFACDIEGITVSFRAYRDFVKNKGSEESTLPGLYLTNDQLFFLNYAQMMCERMTFYGTREAFRDNILPFHVRVNGTLQNSKEFAEAFGCSSGTLLNPETKCTIL